MDYDLTGLRFRSILERVYGKNAAPRDIEGREQLEKIMSATIAEYQEWLAEQGLSVVTKNDVFWYDYPNNMGCQNAAWVLAQRHDGQKGLLVFIAEEQE